MEDEEQEAPDEFLQQLRYTDSPNVPSTTDEIEDEYVAKLQEYANEEVPAENFDFIADDNEDSYDPNNLLDDEDFEKFEEYLEPEAVDYVRSRTRGAYLNRVADYTSEIESNYSPRATGFSADIVQNESGGNYKAFNPAGGGEGAVGKYQFRWTAHKDKIRAFAGDPNLTATEFMNSPQLQDAFYEQYWVPKQLMPGVQQLKRAGASLNESQLAKLIHFRGLQGAKDYLAGNVSDKPEAYNSSISKYIGRQQGGYGIPYSYDPFALQRMEEITVPKINNYNLVANIDEKSVIPQYTPQMYAQDTQDNQEQQKTGAVGMGILGAVNAVDQGLKIGKSIKGLVGSAASQGIGYASSLLNKQAESERLQRELEELYAEKNSEYGMLPNYQNKLKNIFI